MDYMVRAEAADCRIRAFAATTRELVEHARQAHNTSPVATAALGRLLTAGAMMGTMMKGDADLMSIIVKGDGPIGKITVTADSKGRVKGYPDNPTVIIPAKPNGKLDVSGAVGQGTLRVIRDTGLKEPYVGEVDLVSGELAEDLTYYFAMSEQVPSSVGLGVLMNHENTVRQAGGFIIQLMPGCSDEVIDRLEAKLGEVHSVTDLLNSGMSPEDILNELLGEFDVTFYERVPLEFYCNCSKERMAKALITLGRKELQEIIDDGESIELKCHFCNSGYDFSIDELKELLELATR